MLLARWTTWMRSGVGSNNRKTTPATTSTTPSTPTTGPCQRGNNTTGNTGRSGRQKAVTQCSTQREEWVTVQPQCCLSPITQKEVGCQQESVLSEATSCILVW